MPFTFSHPAIILPLKFLPRKFISITGIIVGSISPDFEYFIRMKIQSDFSHTILGLIWFNLPLGIVFAYVFHNIIRDNLFSNLPKMLKSRLLKFRQFGWNEYLKNNLFVVIISILIGSISHLFWDSFTHETGYFVVMIPMLSNKISIADFQIPIFKIIQHSSTIIGIVVITLLLNKLPKTYVQKEDVSAKYWIVFTLVTFSIIFTKVISSFDFKLNGNFFVTSISASIIALIITPFFVQKKLKINN